MDEYVYMCSYRATRKNSLTEWITLYKINIFNKKIPPPPPPGFQIFQSICATPNFKSWIRPCSDPQYAICWVIFFLNLIFAPWGTQEWFRYNLGNNWDFGKISQERTPYLPNIGKSEMKGWLEGLCLIVYWLIRFYQQLKFQHKYCQVSNIRHTLVGNKIIDHSDVVVASPIGVAPTTSSFST